MRKGVLFSALVAGLALAGTRSVTTAGGAPDVTDAGVSLNNAQGCRVSAYLTDGGTLQTVDIRLFYRDPTYLWVPSSTPDCTPDAGVFSDGGDSSAMFCDYAVFSQFGLLGAQLISATMQDGGPAQTQIRVECWGPGIPGGNGAQNL